MRYFSHVALLAALAGATVACGGVSRDSDEGSVEADQPPLEFENHDGRRFVRLDLPENRGDPMRIGGELVDVETLIGTMPTTAAEMDEAQLAQAMRAVTPRFGTWYVAAEPDYEAARRAIELRGKELLGGGPYNPNGIAEIPFGKGCCGSDDRIPANSLPGWESWQWPWATILATMRPIDASNPDWRGNYTNRDCTWQMIGPSTALAVAHCFRPPQNPGEYPLFGPDLEPLIRWGAAADGEGLNSNGQTDAYRPIPPGWPSSPGGVGGFDAYFEFAWLLTPDLLEWDYAVIDFRGQPNPTPGLTSGWQGWGVIAANDILNAGALHVDVPKEDVAGNWYADDEWPRIMWIPEYRNVSSVGAYWVDFDGDCSAGSSGSPVWQYFNGWRVVGVDSRFSGTTPNQCAARRLDSNYASFIEVNSEF